MERKINLCRFIYQYKSNIYCDTPIEIELYWESFLPCIEIDMTQVFLIYLYNKVLHKTKILYV